MNVLLKKLLLGTAILFSTQACLNSGGGSASGAPTETATNPEEGPLSVFDTNIYAINKVVCDPFDPGSPGPNDGLIAKLYYRGAGQPAWGTVLDFLNLGQPSPKNLFFTTINVPTRKFDLGFPVETGGMVKNDAGIDLHEYFAISFRSILKLSDADEEGEYEMALLSDDGAHFNVRQEDGNYRAIVSNDGEHPTRMGCGERLTMTRASEVVVKLDYYQGPRLHIALVPMWRKVTPGQAAEPLCGATSNEMFFDYNNNSAPQPAYNQLLSRGWKPIAAENWNLPGFAIFNPCTDGEVPVISNLRFENVEGMVIASWTTNIPAASQLLYKHVASGLEVLTPSDNHLRGSHRIVIRDMPVGETYDFKAISISVDYGKAISEATRLTIR